MLEPILKPLNAPQHLFTPTSKRSLACRKKNDALCFYVTPPVLMI
jgi:hypothetical protein